MRLRVIDLDGAVTRQPFLGNLIEAGEAGYIDARDLAPKLRIVANRRVLAELKARMEVHKNASAPDVIFYGSGDFHHLVWLFLQQLEEPVTVVHFDNHPDWVRFPNTVNCGSWVARALESHNVRKVVTIGPCSDDLFRPELKSAVLSAVRERRLEIYAWHARPTRLWGAPISVPGVRTVGRNLVWRNLADENWDTFVDEMVLSLPETAIWITIDKDVLARDEAVTNWDQGMMRVEQLLVGVRAVASHRKIVGIDVCGDYSPPKFDDLFRALLAWWDHPAMIQPGEIELAINDKTNTRLVNAFREVLQ
jgi:arginase family enzyme